LGTMSPRKTPILAIGIVLFHDVIHISTSLARWQNTLFEPILQLVARSTANSPVIDEFTNLQQSLIKKE